MNDTRFGYKLSWIEPTQHCVRARNFLGSLHLVAPGEVFEHGSLHPKLGQVEQQEPDDVPHRGDTYPASGDAMDPGEAPVGAHSGDRRSELCDAEGTKEHVRGHLHEEGAVRTCDKVERLRDDGDLEVYV